MPFKAASAVGILALLFVSFVAGEHVGKSERLGVSGTFVPAPGYYGLVAIDTRTGKLCRTVPGLPDEPSPTDDSREAGIFRMMRAVPACR